MIYAGVEVPITGYSPSTNGPNGTIRISNQTIPVGKATVKLKIKLDNGTFLEKEFEVDFKRPTEEQGEG